ncbi:MAG TPA: hypothetical protein PKD53_22555 [Chloroflexaceae bacterium]|nr:hypothetical protein [Chloroflexaceae bacterium]
MSAIAEEVGRLVPLEDEWPLLRGLLLGLAVGATVAGVFMLGRELRARRAARRAGGLPPAPLPGVEPSPL